MRVQAPLLSFAVLVASPSAQAPEAEASVVDAPPTRSSPLYPATTAPLQPLPLTPLPLGAVRPRGWLHAQLRLQADGFHGHLAEISPFLQPDGNAWLDPEGAGHHGWEEPVYWLKGFAACARLLDDEAQLAEASRWIEGILASQKPDGWFGPDAGRDGAATRLVGREDLWPNMIALFCLQDWYEATGDARIPALMQRYFAYLATVPDDHFLVGYWPRMRGGDLLWSVLWLHARTGEPKLLELAEKVHRHTADWTSGVIDWHNVNVAQGFAEPATYGLVSGDARHRLAAYDNEATVLDRYGQVPGGMFGGDENCRPGYTGPRQAIETCGIVELMASLERLCAITGDTHWADRCEEVAFNALPAATTADMKALRYLTAPNLVQSDAGSKQPELQNGGPMLQMNPHIHRCCQHDCGQGWPYFVRSLWFATGDRGLAAMLHGPSVVAAKVADGVPVRIEAATRYPFEDRIEYRVRADEPVAFPLYLRVPGWCERATVAVGGTSLDVAPAAGRFVRLQRTWNDGDSVVLHLPQKVSVRRWAANFDSASIDRGPLTYSLRIGTRRERAGGTDAWPAWNLWPTTPWNYGLVLGDPSAFEVDARSWPTDDRPWSADAVPLVLRTQGRRIPQWHVDALGLVGPLQPSPVRSGESDTTIELIPMGAARLRLSAFPVIGTGDDAHDWGAPQGLRYRPSASHTFEHDSVDAVHDGLLPKSSIDHAIPRHTFWDHRGGREWLQADFERPQRLSHVAVYWFDDTGIGGCRVPSSWRVLARTGDDWNEVARADHAVADRFDTLDFPTVTTQAVRLQVELQDNASAGVLEWTLQSPLSRRQDAEQHDDQR